MSGPSGESQGQCGGRGHEETSLPRCDGGEGRRTEDRKLALSYSGSLPGCAFMSLWRWGICVSVRVHARVACLRACVFVCVRACVHACVCVCVCVRACVCVCLRTHIHVCICACVLMCVGLSTSMCVHVCLGVFALAACLSTSTVDGYTTRYIS